MIARKNTFGITKSCDKSADFTGLVHKIFVTYISCRMHKLIPSNTLQLLLNGKNKFLSFQFHQKLQEYELFSPFWWFNAIQTGALVHQFSVSLELVNDFSDP
jgi:hypothetical protein